MSLWNSIEQLGRAQDAINLTLVIAGVITAILAVVAYITSQRLDELKDARDAVRQAQVTAAEATARDAQERSTRLAEQQKPRQLAAQEAALLRQALANIPKGEVVITAAMADAESERFAQQIYDLLLAAGWTPKGVDLSMWMPTPTGIFVAVRDGQSPPPHAGPLQAALQRAGVTAPGVVVPDTAEGTVEIRVGVKPQ
jgi:hypothetical protein